MFKNFFKTAWRNIIKNKTFSIINITGLSVSVAFCLLLFFYIRDEQSYDSFHAKKDHLFRLEMTDTRPPLGPVKKKGLFSFLSKGDDMRNDLGFPLIVAANLQNTFPEIKSITRFHDDWSDIIKTNIGAYRERSILYADSNFFSNFSFHLLQGDPETVLNSPGNIVISASLAKKYFGNLNPVGKTIQLITDTTHTYIISGVAEDAPHNSSIQYSVVMPLLSYPDYRNDINVGFNHASYSYIVELATTVDYKKFEAKMNKWVSDYFKSFIDNYAKHNANHDSKNFRWYLRPLADAHYNASAGWGHYTDVNKMYQLTCLVIIILLIAALNYVLLGISNAASRSQEIGVRKVLGAKRISVITQFWIETLIVTGIAVVIGFILTQLLLPLFNSVMDVQISFSNFSSLNIVAALILLTLILSVAAGYYPALLISKAKPALVIKNIQTFKINPRLSKVMVVVQYTSCVVLIIAALIINRQMNYINNKYLGFDKDQVLMVNNPKSDSSYTKQLTERLQAFAQSQPGISEFSAMSGSLYGSFNTYEFTLNGTNQLAKELDVYYNYFDVLGIKLLQGRFFSKAFSLDTSGSIKPIIVNETLFKMLGKDAKVGVYNQPLDATIIGVVKDYNFENLSQKIEPEEHSLETKYLGTFMFKVKAGNMQNVIASLQKQWKEISDNYPFEYTFLDQNIAEMYDTDLHWQKIIQASCFFAIFIACMGLFGLSAINAINRTKEIGIRKVLGATVKDIVTTLSSSFIAMISISIVIAIPIAWWVMNNWLEDFAYRINIKWWMFAIAGAIALLIALITISFQAIKAAIANPVKSLRTE